MVKEESVVVSVGEEPADGLTSQRLVIGYDYAKEVEEVEGWEREASRVVFNPYFLDGLNYSR